MCLRLLVQLSSLHPWSALRLLVLRPGQQVQAETALLKQAGLQQQQQQQKELLLLLWVPPEGCWLLAFWLLPGRRQLLQRPQGRQQRAV